MAHWKSDPGPSANISKKWDEDDHDAEDSDSSNNTDQEEEEADKEVEEDDEYAAVKKELSEMSFEDLQKLKEKLGIKVFNSAMYGSKSHKGKTVYKRENKNR